MSRGHCHWCGRYKHLLQGGLGEKVCGYCIEEPEYVEHVHRQNRIEAREKLKVRKGHRPPVMPRRGDD